MILESSYSRNAHYRADFFANNKPIIKNGKPYYRCVYCGRLFQKNQITIDHLYPIHKVKNSSFRNINRELLKKFDIEDINDCKNLVAACSSCNKRKSKKNWSMADQRIFRKISSFLENSILCSNFIFMFRDIHYAI